MNFDTNLDFSKNTRYKYKVRAFLMYKIKSREVQKIVRKTSTSTSKILTDDKANFYFLAQKFEILLILK